jgi:hypothetical protein
MQDLPKREQVFGGELLSVVSPYKKNMTLDKEDNVTIIK